ncbi:MAG: hypothetical protein HY714_04760 [Candidatus Omnitrophica bacterium]|nr:hypothetical protein [Candidatus Omnitrophota bacterium]
MMVLGPLLFAAGLGFLFLYWAAGNRSFSCRVFFLAVFSLPAGLVLISVLLFWSYVLAGPHAPLALFGLAYLAGAALLIAVVKRPLQEGATEGGGFKGFARLIFPSGLRCLPYVAGGMLLTAGLLRAGRFFLYSLSWDTHGRWDARFFWNMKARFFFRSPEAWKDMFTPVLEWAHPDYPLFLPATTAWGWLWNGRELLIWPHAVSIVFNLALVLLVVWFFAFRKATWAGLTAAGFLLMAEIHRVWAFTLMADLPLCFFIAAACAIGLAGIRERSGPLLFVSGFFTGAAAWCKNEGIFFIFWMILIFGGILLAGDSRPRAERIRAGLRFLAGLALPLSCVIYLKLFLAPPSEFATNAQGPARLITLLFAEPQKSGFIFLSFLNFMITPAYWNGLWYFFALALGVGLLFKRAEWRLHHGWSLAALALLMQAGYILVYHLTPHDIAWHIQTSLPRLLLHSAMPALLFIFDTLAFNLQTAGHETSS